LLKEYWAFKHTNHIGKMQGEGEIFCEIWQGNYNYLKRQQIKTNNINAFLNLKNSLLTPIPLPKN
jgi:hypothetical protein